MPFRSAVLDALAVLAPVDCAGCGAPDRALCNDCRAEFATRPAAHPLDDGLVVTAAATYAGAVRNALLAFKERGRTDVARPLGRALAESVGEALAQALAAGVGSGVEFAAVPTSAASWRKRGYDPVALLCRRAGIRVARVLLHGRATLSQKTLGEVERASNLRGSLRARRRLDGRRFILVDDVVTTGATLREARRAILDAGGDVVGAATLAFTPRLFRAPPVTLRKVIADSVTFPEGGSTVGLKA